MPAVPAAPPPAAVEAPAAPEADDSECGRRREWEEPAADWDESEDDAEFPIADYDELTVDEILPLLPQLYTDELDVVENRERLVRVAHDRQRAPAATRRQGDAVEVEPEADAEYDRKKRSSPIGTTDQLSNRRDRRVAAGARRQELALVARHEAVSQRRRAVLQSIDGRLAPAPRRSAPVKKMQHRHARRAGKKKAAPAKRPRREESCAREEVAPAKKSAPAKKAATPRRRLRPRKKADRRRKLRP